MCNAAFDVIINALIAVGTLAIVFIAVWGEWLRYKLTPPKLKIVNHNLRGTVTRFTNGPRVIYYHLKVTNSRFWSPAKNCRVIIKSISRRLPNNEFIKVAVPVPPSFVWAPAEISPTVLTVSKEQIFDFGRVIENDKRFSPVLYFYPNDFQGFVGPNEAVRYSLEIVADGFTQERYQVFEVAWDGKWSDNLDEMSQHLIIRELVDESQA